MTIEDAINSVKPADPDAYRAAQARLDRLTKPQGSLGRLEDLAARWAAMTGDVKPAIPRAAVYTFAADHGVVAEGVSAYPSAVTAQMVLNFVRGGAAVNVLARHVGAEVRVVDIGVAHDFGTVPGLIARKVAKGTKNFLREPAMTDDEARRAVTVGVELAEQAVHDGFGLLGTGEMGIGNTTASAAIAAVYTELPVAQVVGRGTGVDDAGLARKTTVIQQALAQHGFASRLGPADPWEVLRKVGGLEIAGLAGLIVGAAALRVPVVLDGFIAGAAALIAVGLQPNCRDYLLASHRSVEAGHQAVLDRLALSPLLTLDLRLGEGTGACLGIGLVLASLKIMTEMATFGEAGVSERQG